ncbi:phospholipase A1 1-like [Arctopsyche grandis]|uniref:phospholipase A1 1-like n=1 Tax=Arctopsyche grandis TaxID=121162 RepID=UPI00406D7729
MDLRYWRCILKRHRTCPDREINFFMYTPEHPKSQRVDVLRKGSLMDMGWDPARKNVIIIHGFNGTEGKTPMSFIKDAYVYRGDYNVFTVDWAPLTKFPCYLSALSNTKLVGQCVAQLYSRLTREGALSKMTTCVGHSLGAHICGMISNHLTEPQYKIVGLDPARPLVSQYGSKAFRLTRDDAHVVQVLHTNAGFLGETGLVGHTDFCINGGRSQPGCRGHVIRKARCSHFQSACYFAASVRRRLKLVGVPCDTRCPKDEGHWGLEAGRNSVLMGEETPEKANGMFCIKIDHNEDCPFD